MHTQPAIAEWPTVDESLIPSDSIFNNPVVNELSESLLSNAMGNIEFPYIIKDKVLMSEGIWNNFYYSSSVIQDAFNNTNWEDRRLRNLFLDHKDKQTSEWIGEVTNINQKGDTLYGDLVIYDPLFATKMEYGKPRFGISPKTFGEADRYTRTMKSFKFENFSVVIDPAVKTAYINNSEMGEMAPDGKVDYELNEYYNFIKVMKLENPNMTYEQIAKAWVRKPTENSELNEIKSQITEIDNMKSQLAEITKILKTINGGEKMGDELNAEAPKAEVPTVEIKTAEPKSEVTLVKEVPEVIPVVEPVVEIKQAVKEEPVTVAPTPVAVEPVKAEVRTEPARDELAEIVSKLAIIEKKLGAPDRLSVKGTPSNTVNMDPDEGMLKYLENMGSKEVRL